MSDDDVLLVSDSRGRRVSVFWSFSIPFATTTALLAAVVTLSAIGFVRSNDAAALEKANHADVMNAVAALRGVADAECSLGGVVWKQHEPGQSHDFLLMPGETIWHNRSNTLGTPCHDTFATTYLAFEDGDELRRRLTMTIGRLPDLNKGYGKETSITVQSSLAGSKSQPEFVSLPE